MIDTGSGRIDGGFYNKGRLRFKNSSWQFILIKEGFLHWGKMSMFPKCILASLVFRQGGFERVEEWPELSVRLQLPLLHFSPAPLAVLRAPPVAGQWAFSASCTLHHHSSPPAPRSRAIQPLRSVLHCNPYVTDSLACLPTLSFTSWSTILSCGVF